METSTTKLTRKEYNDIPVYFCKHCLSLRIMTTDSIDYCDVCGSTDITKGHISDWEGLYQLKYDNNFLNPTNDE